MAIDLKREWSTADVSTLLASVEDDRNWRLEVSSDGIASLHDLSIVPDAAYEEALHCFFEIWDQGTDFVGPGGRRRQEPVQEDRGAPSRELSHAPGSANAFGALRGCGRIPRMPGLAGAANM